MTAQYKRPKEGRPSDRDFAEDSVQWAVFKGALNSVNSYIGGGLTVVGITAGVLSIMNPISWWIAGAGLVWAAGSFAFNYFGRNSKSTAEYRKELLQKRREIDLGIIEALQHEARRSGFDREEREAGELWNAYQALLTLLDDNASYNDPEATQYRNLADSLFQVGCVNLSMVIDLGRNLASVDLDALERERREYERELGFKKTQENRERVAYLQREIATVSEKIANYRQSEARRDERLAKHNEFERDLQQAALTLADVGLGHSASVDWTRAQSDLRNALDAVVGADQELKKRVAELA